MAHLQLLVAPSGEAPSSELEPDKFAGWRAAAFFLCASTPHHDAHSTVGLSSAIFQVNHRHHTW